ncbi:MAG: hypothetical protein K2J39_07435, partial [Ruminococcus sp.]|nr:hypothetical protein [Ruminococcus sp.]
SLSLVKDDVKKKRKDLMEEKNQLIKDNDILKGKISLLEKQLKDRNNQIDSLERQLNASNIDIAKKLENIFSKIESDNAIAIECLKRFLGNTQVINSGGNESENTTETDNQDETSVENPPESERQDSSGKTNITGGYEITKYNEKTSFNEGSECSW